MLHTSKINFIHLHLYQYLKYIIGLIALTISVHKSYIFISLTVMGNCCLSSSCQSRRSGGKFGRVFCHISLLKLNMALKTAIR